MVYIDDLVNAVTAAIHTDLSGVVDICSGNHLPIADLYEAVADELGSWAAAVRVPRPADDVAQMELTRPGRSRI
jgi:nucleoside-diphosphate-sugar epimerase